LLEGDHHLEQRVAAQIAFRLQHIYQFLEGQFLMVIRA
jgi:hypothetical protein